jgi:hypothetical protein
VSAQLNATDEQPYQAFNLTIRADSTLQTVQDAFALKVTVTAFRGSLPIGEALTSKISVPASTFKDKAQAELWASQAFRSFRARVTAAILEEAALTLGDEANWALDDLKIEQMDAQEVVQNHLRGTTKRLQERFNIQRPGRQSQWERLELMQAMKEALLSLPEQERTLANAVDRLKETHPEKAPDSADALGKIMKRQNIAWKDLKKDLRRF